MTIDELLQRSETDLSDPIQLCADGNWRWGSLQAILYDPRRADIFQQPFLYSLYERTRLSGQRHPQPLDLAARRGLGLLPALFCGMTNLGPDAICKYLSERAVCVIGEWREKPVVEFTSQCVDENGSNYKAEVVDKESFFPLGYCFPSTVPLVSALTTAVTPANSVFGGYTLFSEIWRKPQQLILSYLGLAWLFHTYRLAALHGSRYATNHLTKRWVEQFGFRDCGELPYCMMEEPGGPLVGGVYSTLLRTDFEERLREVLQRTRELSSSFTLPTPSIPSPTST
jgi:hypothetical protein